jgi:NhaP-type Na+/H+ or K+/H+ antiporter
VLLVLFGGAMTGGGLFSALTWQAAVFGLLALFVVRPLAGWIGLIGTDPPPGERAAISFFGIRGIGSIYYLAYALSHAKFDNGHLLWSTAGFIILVSIVLHGITVTPTMRRLDLRRKRAERAAARA